MKRYRVLIVDDEPLARERLRALLGGEASMELAGECADGWEAVAAIRRRSFDVVFLDVQMPGCDGLQVVEELAAAERPAIIFVTGHERFAVRAFDLQAVDYLLKPFDRERLQQALKRAQDHLRARPPIAPARGPERVAVRANGRIVFLKPSEVVWVEAANNYCTLHLADASQLTIRVKLSAIEQRLGHANFARVNRSAVVHLEQVKELQLVEHGDYVVVLRNGLRLPLSRQLRGSLQKLAADAGSAAGPGFAPAG